MLPLALSCARPLVQPWAMKSKCGVSPLMMQPMAISYFAVTAVNLLLGTILVFCARNVLVNAQLNNR